ncbi:DNA adenine methylase [Vibrio crassostreae]|uniref:DNA adenine methylase n=1 Tax=Vibrio crassostreae TaxID=246167 RepID=UPI001B307C6E|nr:DNA adenine methylase [Vibrio crassostreae]
MNTPHVLAYQGSKRKLASKIEQYIPHNHYKRLIEPFAGSASMTLHCAHRELFESYIVGESWVALADFWQTLLSSPELIIDGYESIWSKQNDDPAFNRVMFFEVRERFNKNPNPWELYYLITRCVKNSIRFNSNGEFNQSCDNRRKGVSPMKVARNIKAASNLLTGRTEVHYGDYELLLSKASRGDLVYLDPPWQGVSGKTKDKRYFEQLDLDRFVNNLTLLNERGVDFILSFDGSKGDVTYHDGFSSSLNMKRVELDAGLSAQSLLNGQKEKTIESLYLSEGIVKKLLKTKKNL